MKSNSLKNWMQKVRENQQQGKRKHDNFVEDQAQKQESEQSEREQSEYQNFIDFFGDEKIAKKIQNKNKRIDSQNEDKKLGIK